MDVWGKGNRIMQEPVRLYMKYDINFCVYDYYFTEVKTGMNSNAPYLKVSYYERYDRYAVHYGNALLNTNIARPVIGAIKWQTPIIMGLRLNGLDFEFRVHSMEEHYHRPDGFAVIYHDNHVNNVHYAYDIASDGPSENG